MSNGGEMCYLLAYLKPDVFAAVAPVAGLTLEWMYRKLKARKGVPLFEIHGTEDRTSEWTGDPTNKGGWGAYVAVPLAVGYWAAANGCTHEITEEIPVKDPSNGHRAIAHRYVGGVGGNEVWLYEIVNGKHSWGEKDIDTAAEVWRFFRCYVEGGRK
jgi:poly(3-hydroxybutyrate) depolymerase